MTNTDYRIGQAFAALSTIDFIRQEMGNPNAGKCFERVLLVNELLDVERATVIQEIEEKYPGASLQAGK